MRRRFGSRSSSEQGSNGTLGWLSAFDVPRFSAFLREDTTTSRTTPMTGLKHTIMVSVIGLIAFLVLSAGLSVRAIQHGQVSFVVAASVCIGCYFTHRYVPVYSALWSILAVELMAVTSYTVSGFYAPAASEPVCIPASPFMRVLPIQYVAVGTAAAIAMFWNRRFHIIFSDAQHASRDRSSARKE